VALNSLHVFFVIASLFRDCLAALNEAMGHLPTQTEQSAPPVMGTADTVNAIKRSMSSDARARIVEAQRKRLAVARRSEGAKQATSEASPSTRTFSPAARRKIAEAARRRWAAAKRAGKNRL